MNYELYNVAGIESLIEVANELIVDVNRKGLNEVQQKIVVLGPSLRLYTDFFGQDRISCQSLLEVLIPPYLKIAQKLGLLTERSASSASMLALQALYYCWRDILLWAAGVQLYKGNLCMDKKTELRRTVFHGSGVVRMDISIVAII